MGMCVSVYVIPDKDVMTVDQCMKSHAINVLSCTVCTVTASFLYLVSFVCSYNIIIPSAHYPLQNHDHPPPF